MKKILASGGLILAAVGAVIALLKAFGVPIDDTQSAAITAVVSAVLGLVAAYFHPDIPLGPKQ